MTQFISSLINSLHSIILVSPSMFSWEHASLSSNLMGVWPGDHGGIELTGYDIVRQSIVS